MSFPIEVPETPVYQGDSLTMSYVLKDGDPATPIDLVEDGWTGWVAQWRPFPASPEFEEFGIDVSGASTGHVVLSLTPTQTASLRNGVWDLQAERSGEVRTWLRGELIFSKDVTRD